jgi:cobalamin biosynthesis protein CobT
VPRTKEARRRVAGVASAGPDSCPAAPLLRFLQAQRFQGQVLLIDGDTYTPRNLERQDAHHEDLNTPKAQALVRRLALRGANADLSRVWRRLEVRRDPKVAVSLLLDCSGSMSGEKIALARAAAEKIGTRDEKRGVSSALTPLSSLLSPQSAPGVPAEIMRDYSRFVPFKGLVFKEFGESRTPTSLFTETRMEANLDGEAVLWALSRLAKRPERTKLCVVLSDGMPAASLSSTPELERHLYTVCKRAEAKEKEGLFLVGLGITQERVREFYRNAAVINAVEELPRAVLGIVEAVLGKVVGTLG